MTPQGFIARESSFDPTVTMDRLIAAAVADGMAILARIDHTAAAAKVGMDLRPTEVLILGNPRTGTPIMQDVQTAAIDLPLKALVWQDSAGKTWIAYNDPMWIGNRHGVGAHTEPLLRGMADKLAKAVAAASGGARVS
ncbi:DUF302 domain-containing protein [Mesorhizobium sp. WSM4307]|uniref:DUF302 domain-containing protein n=1 Tax=unclassified Mesorhizobium TaxID=325217 RepID=UPI00115EAD99|nr:MULTISPECIES: DUF302 domain-containing protein [unclassified Mesorhizobium]TRC75532.1 DUF302 domain-containing protein [Mesorhizobium sp. WSM4315]TRC86459.1 DUF302 domain-containing protein [Mesorhizobium sp. WSM4307]